MDTRSVHAAAFVCALLVGIHAAGAVWAAQGDARTPTTA